MATPLESPEQQRQLLSEFRNAIGNGNEKYDDTYLRRYLIARSWDIQAAKEQLDATIAWRASRNIDDIAVAGNGNGLPVLYAVRGFTSVPDSNLEAREGISESVLRVNKYLGGTALHKTCKEGYPVYIERLGYHDAKGIAKNCTLEEITDYHIACNEFLHRTIMTECSKQNGKPVHLETIIFDCTGMGWHQFHMPALQLLRGIIDIDQKYYPETMNRLFLVNAPTAFVTVWRIIKGWLDPGVAEKIQILGSDYQKTLLTHIAAENLPAFLGGKCNCDHVSGGCVPRQAISGKISLSAPKEIVSKVSKSYQPYTEDLMKEARIPISTYAREE